tara:strand:- start:12086 stop:13285 length:1200 start_codon:yes stop_codon:yes gene_type:complete
MNTAWEMVPFESLYAEPSKNGVYKSKEFHGAGAKIVNMGELFGNEFIGPQEMKRIQMSDTELQKSGLIEGDLLFGRRSLVEEGAGKCSIVKGLTDETTFESSIIRVRLNQSEVIPDFYYYWFKSRIGRAGIKAIVTGTNVKGIKSSNLRKVLVAKPSTQSQKSVVDTIYKYDELIENNNRRISLLEESARELYKEWFVRFRFPGHEHVKIIDGVPEGWRKKTLIDIADLTMGQSPKSEFYNQEGEGLPFHQGVTNYGFRFVSHETWCTKQTRLAESGDILFSVRAPVGRLNITLDKMILGRGLASIRTKAGCQSFLFYQLKSVFFKEDMIGGGAIYASVTKKDLESFELLVPTNSLLLEFDEIASNIDAQIKTLHLSNQNLIEARDLLLPKLMSGEIAV